MSRRPNIRTRHYLSIFAVLPWKISSPSLSGSFASGPQTVLFVSCRPGVPERLIPITELLLFQEHHKGAPTYATILRHLLEPILNKTTLLSC